MPTPLSFGLIGAGWIGSFHAQTLASRLPNARLVAVADPVPGAAERFSIPRAYRDPLELIDDPAVEAVAICSPAASHADLVVAAAQARKHVFCEKPMALTLDDADRAIDAAQAAGVALQSDSTAASRTTSPTCVPGSSTGRSARLSCCGR